MQVALLSLHKLDLLQNHERVLGASGEAWNFGFLAACVNECVPHEKAGQSPCQDGEEDLPLYIQQGDAPELGDVMGDVLFGIEHTNGLLPTCWNCSCAACRAVL